MDVFSKEHETSKKGTLARKPKKVKAEARKKAIEEREKFRGMQIRPPAYS